MFEPTLKRALSEKIIPRIWLKDPSLWKINPADQSEITNRLGWLWAPEKAGLYLEEYLAFAGDVRRDRVQTVVLMGMGGSSLAPEVFQAVFGGRRGYPRLIILDSTDPERVRDVEASLDLVRTLFIFSSKSGSTLEPLSMYRYFRSRVEKKFSNAGRHFVAITDPGTNLEAFARKEGFRRIFNADPDVGGRFSALTAFGLVPAALVGVDIEKIIQRAKKMAQKCAIAGKQNPALEFGIRMAVWAQSGRNKLTIQTSRALRSFGDWAEQLIAESTGKEGKGIVPIVREPLGPSRVYGSDRFFVTIDSIGREPSLSFKTGSPLDLGAEMFRWEFATAVAGWVLGINPFNQPNVQDAKERAGAFLQNRNHPPLGWKSHPRGGKIKVSGRLSGGGGGGKDPLKVFWDSILPGDGLHLLAFLPDRPAIRKTLEKLRIQIRNSTRLAVTIGFGPRYLHSTGQLHKGGADDAVFVLITAARKTRLDVPGETYSFEELEFAQAAGDFAALDARKRRAIWVELPDPKPQTLARNLRLPGL